MHGTTNDYLDGAPCSRVGVFTATSREGVPGAKVSLGTPQYSNVSTLTDPALMRQLAVQLLTAADWTEQHTANAVKERKPVAWGVMFPGAEVHPQAYLSRSFAQGVVDHHGGQLVELFPAEDETP